MATDGILSRIGGLVTGESDMSPLLNVGLGLLSASGPSATPMSTGQRIAQGFGTAGQLQQQMSQNQMLRQEMQDRARRRDAQEEIAGLLQPGMVADQQPTIEQMRQGAPMLGAELSAQQVPAAGLLEAGGFQSPEVMGLLAQADPERFTQGLMGQVFPEGRSETSLIRNLRGAGIDPTSDEGREIIRANLAGTTNDQQMMAMDMQLRGIELQNAMREQQNEIRSERENRAAVSQGIQRDLREAKRMVEINNELRDTALETGVPLSDWRRAAASGTSAVARLFGLEETSSEADRLATLADEFEKSSSRFATETAARMFSGGNLTNMQLQSIQQQVPSMAVTPDANEKIIANNLEILLDSAQRSGIEIKDSDEFESLIEGLRGGGGQQTEEPQQEQQTQTQITPSRIQRMPRQEFESINVDQIRTAEQRRAADRRARELGLIGEDESLF